MADFKVVLKLSEKRVSELFILACEGGSNYWARRVDPTTHDGDAYERMARGFTCTYWAEEHDQERTVTIPRQAIENAVGLMATKYPLAFAAVLTENDDAETGDVFLQLCCFGEVLYG